MVSNKKMTQQSPECLMYSSWPGKSSSLIKVPRENMFKKTGFR